jgi:hypothetical protein
MTHSPDLDKLAAALSAFQGTLKAAPLNQQGEKRRYADIEAIWVLIRKPLRRHRLSVVQFGGYTEIETVLIHESGQFISSTAKCEPHTDGDVSYGARWAIMRLLGIIEESEFDLNMRLYGRPSLSQVTAADIIARNRASTSKETSDFINDLIAMKAGQESAHAK